jgi:hypothetical protein
MLIELGYSIILHGYREGVRFPNRTGRGERREEAFVSRRR